jgi:ribosomal protein L13
MAAKNKVTFRRNDDSGAGVIVNADDVDKFLETCDNKERYTRETVEQRKTKQAAADEEVKQKAQAKAEDKAVNAPARRV